MVRDKCRGSSDASPLTRHKGTPIKDPIPCAMPGEDHGEPQMTEVTRCKECGRLDNARLPQQQCMNGLSHETWHDKQSDPRCARCNADALAAKALALRIVAWRLWLILRRALWKG